MEWHERIGRRLKLRDLHTLEAVVRLGSMAKAAASLAITQSAISKSVAEMELTLGVPLLERSARGVEPTVYGRALLKRGLAVFDELRQGLKEIEFLADPAAGELRIGTTEPMAAIAAAVIDRLAPRFPRAVFHVRDADTGTLIGLLRDRAIELAITRMAEPVTEDDLHRDILFHDPLVVMAGKENPWVGRRNLKLAQLMDERWIMPPPDTFLRPFIVEAFRACGLELPRATVVTASAVMRDMLLPTGRFLTIHPRAKLRIPRRHLELRELNVALPTTRRPIGLMMLMRRQPSPLAKHFVEAARAVTKPLANAA
jgi:DNA-binding transcriptional LysR family regulator